MEDFSWSLYDAQQAPCIVCSDGGTQFLSVLEAVETEMSPLDESWGRADEARRDRAAAISQWKAAKARAEAMKAELDRLRKLYNFLQTYCAMPVAKREWHERELIEAVAIAGTVVAKPVRRKL